METDLRGYMRIVWKHRRQIGALFILALLVGFLGSMAITPVYRATTTLLVKQAGTAGTLSLFSELGGLSRNHVLNYVQILKSRSLAKNMAGILGIDPEDPSGRFDDLCRGISVEPIAGTDAISVSVESTDPGEAVRAANALVEAFVRRTQRDNQADVRAAREFIESQLASVRRDLSQAEDAAQEYQSSSGLIEPSREVAAMVTRLADLESAKAEASLAVAEGEARFAELNRQLSDQEQTVLSSQTFSENPIVTQYKQAMADLQLKRAEALEKYAPHHPVVLALNGQIADVEKSLKAEMGRILSTEVVMLNPVRQAIIQEALGVQAATIAARSKRDGLERLIEQIEKRFAQLPTQEVQLARLMRNRQAIENIYLMLMQKHQEFRITEEMKTADVQVIDPAEMPKDPVRPNTILNMAIAGLLALFAGCSLGFLLESFDTTIKTAEDVQQYLDLPVLGMIPSTVLERNLRVSRKPFFALKAFRRKGWVK